MIAVPDNGRYRLHNEIDDCIVCDKCAKICPVDCIEIEAVRAVEEFGRTSDGTPKRIYAARFDIDMGKCCFCGLCTTVCPTECLTMTKVFDFSVTDIRDHTYAFAEMSDDEIASKKNLFEAWQKSKVQPAAASGENKPVSEAPKSAAPKPVFRPKIKPPGSNPPGT
jgi:NADH-quinone oxidoreductase subunit I